MLEEGFVDPTALEQEDLSDAIAEENGLDAGGWSPFDEQEPAGVIRTLDGEIAGDEFAQDALNYQILLNKIDNLLDRLKLDA
jgi:ankyrin repeat/BTB/POZ domain-containing protein 1